MGDLVIEQRILAGSDFTGTNGGSSGTITTVAGASLLEGEAFYLRDNLCSENTFTFRSAAMARQFPNGTFNRNVLFDAAMSADDMRDAIIEQINRAPNLSLLASDGGAATVNLLRRLGGTEGNVTPTPDTVADAGFVVSPMSGGTAVVPSKLIRGVRVYDAAAEGGVIDFDFVLPMSVDQRTLIGGVATWRVEHVRIDISGGTSCLLEIVQKDDRRFAVYSGAGPLVMLTTPFYLAGDERLILTSVGGTQAMTVRVMAKPDRLV
jgi:hypothetical protein